MLDYNELFSKSKEIAKETGLTQLEYIKDLCLKEF